MKKALAVIFIFSSTASLLSVAELEEVGRSGASDCITVTDKQGRSSQACATQCKSNSDCTPKPSTQVPGTPAMGTDYRCKNGYCESRSTNIRGAGWQKVYSLSDATRTIAESK